MLTDPMVMTFAVEYLQAKDYIVSIHDIHHIPLEISHLLREIA